MSVTDPKQFIHLLLSTLTLAVLCLAALQAILFAVQERQLHRKRLKGFIAMLPPLQTMEVRLFKFITAGFLLLTLLLLLSFWSFQAVIAPHWIEKTLVSIIAWLVFAVLLLGRYYWGWRGPTAVRFALAGVGLVTFIYFGKQWIQ